MATVSVLFNEPKLLKLDGKGDWLTPNLAVSVLFNEPKLLKCPICAASAATGSGFSALQRAEIAEIQRRAVDLSGNVRRFSALQRAEIAEITSVAQTREYPHRVSVLFNEPKLLKLSQIGVSRRRPKCFSALQRAEIAEMLAAQIGLVGVTTFQCSSTSRNC